MAACACTPEDVAHLYEDVPTGSPVRIVHQPYKVGHHRGEWFLEAHPPFEGEREMVRDDLSPLIDALYDVMTEHGVDTIDNRAAIKAAREPDGVPMVLPAGG